VITTQSNNIEVQEGLSAYKKFEFKDISTGLSSDLTGYVVEIKVQFEYLPIAISYSSDTSPWVAVNGPAGSVTISLPWLDLYENEIGTANYWLYGQSPSGQKILFSKGLYTILEGPSEDEQSPVGSTSSNKYSIRKITEDYQLTVNDSTILVDATQSPINITLLDTLYGYANGRGILYNIKRVDSGSNLVTLVGTVDGGANKTITGSGSIQVQAFEDGYYVVGNTGTGSGGTEDPGDTTGDDVSQFTFIAAIF
jgi:hypothetical protein